ncbi:hypothetical protein [Phenylobacterium sp.]|uniref:hypothetical protein n=1 Tax=Phenylobacterium sp. TaxID=1871053 RepID=UPI0035AF3E69
MDYRKLLSGVGIAAVAGLLLGGAMKPDLRGDERPEGPQIFAGWSGARSTGPFDDGMTLTYWQGKLPDYVVGTDWKQAIAWQEAPEIIEAEPYDGSAFDVPEPEPAEYAYARWEEPPAEAPHYPSMSGGVAYGAERAYGGDRLDAPPPPPEFDAEVMPEATGDTTTEQG